MFNLFVLFINREHHVPTPNYTILKLHAVFIFIEAFIVFDFLLEYVFFAHTHGVNTRRDIQYFFPESIGARAQVPIDHFGAIFYRNHLHPSKFFKGV